MFEPYCQVTDELVPSRHRHAGAHQAALLQCAHALRVVDEIPEVAVAAGAIDAARELEGFLGAHHADLYRRVLRYGGRPDGLVVFVFRELLANVGVGQVLDELYPVAAASQVDEATSSANER
jgi:hypothetical protein